MRVGTGLRWIGPAGIAAMLGAALASPPFVPDWLKAVGVTVAILGTLVYAVLLIGIRGALAAEVRERQQAVRRR